MLRVYSNAGINTLLLPTIPLVDNGKQWVSTFNKVTAQLSPFPTTVRNSSASVAQWCRKIFYRDKATKPDFPLRIFFYLEVGANFKT